jgi:drug/metabolite transporter (DMT)-like permease
VKFIREMGGGTPMFVDPALPPALASAALGGVSAILLKKATGGADAFAVNFVKLVAGSASLAVAALALGFKPPSTAVAIRMAYVGLTGPLLGWYLYIKALSLGGVSAASTIANTYPLVAVAAAYLLGSAPKPNHVAGALLVVAGMRLLLSGNSGEDRRRAALLAGATSVLWGVNQVVAKAAAGESDPMTLSLLRVLFAAIPAAPVALARGLELSRGALAAAAAAGLVSDFLGALLWLLSLRVGSLAVAATVSATTPVFAAMLSSLLLGEEMNRKRWLGVLAATAGVAVVSYAA